ncbi:MAG: hypothetical protein A2W93_13575 [Bacteroidetes bacterium GWF2_43_63]|nr:MAG: hypothetical protein A2W94_03770 [Bacteroidetes bacterium GWE2_42_42]OFY55020.1 MAG: hypothetical protein A2W93_13575 [Bacteroidetes bacterium GWF2_43_63]HBG69555.1 hypothetical protein [Bacteroidales bacterium]HCB60706.1 hypothetical protein [Bacteroidales bacterium]HCY23990.1 hypothetical protein [Bacteroidales bacterium]
MAFCYITISLNGLIFTNCSRTTMLARVCPLATIYMSVTFVRISQLAFRISSAAADSYFARRSPIYHVSREGAQPQP